MGIVNYAAEKKLLVVARGHPYDRNAIASAFDSFEAYNWSLVEQPAAQRLLGPELASDYDACVCYDMPGVDFTTESDPARSLAPEPDVIERYLALLEAGMGMVYLHHSLAAWPDWPEYAEIVGGRFHYRPARLRDRDYPDSGYRHSVQHKIQVLGAHPVTAGLPAHFQMTDELYLCPVFEQEVIPLLASDYGFEAKNFYSANMAVNGRMHCSEGWTHPPGSGLVAWVKHYRNSPIVYLQGGDDASVWADENYRSLLRNAIDWVSSDEAHSWAKQQYKEEVQ